VKKNKTGNKPKVEAIVEPVKGYDPSETTELERLGSLDQSTTNAQGVDISVGWVRRLLPDVLKVVGALIVISVALVILVIPPLVQSDFPKVTYSYNGATYTNATLYRPLAMPTRYYIALPEKIAGRYQFFAVDRRREVATLMTNKLSRTIFGMPAIKRTDPMGLDLEFRRLDNSEWRVSFLPETILFSNAVLAVRLDVK
jgi:hypothetical protein